jgi:hypothetical protein
MQTKTNFFALVLLCVTYILECACFSAAFDTGNSAIYLLLLEHAAEKKHICPCHLSDL